MPTLWIRTAEPCLVSLAQALRQPQEPVNKAGARSWTCRAADTRSLVKEEGQVVGLVEPLSPSRRSFQIGGGGRTLAGTQAAGQVFLGLEAAPPPVATRNLYFLIWALAIRGPLPEARRSPRAWTGVQGASQFLASFTPRALMLFKKEKSQWPEPTLTASILFPASIEQRIR